MGRKNPTVFLEVELVREGLPCVVELSERDAHHLAKVLRLPTGTAIKVFDRSGGAYHGELLRENGGEAARLRVTGVEQAAAQGAEKFHCVVFQAPPRGGHMDAFIPPLSELGVAAFVPMVTARTVYSEKGSGWESRLKRWERLAREAAKQSGRGKPMEIFAPLRFAHVLDRRQEFDLAFLLTPRAEGAVSRADLVEKLRKLPQKIPHCALLTGPEGGFTPQEEEAALKAGFLPWCINSWVLRSETAAMSATAILHFMLS